MPEIISGGVDRRVPWGLLYLLEFLGGMAFSGLGAVLPDLSAAFALSYGQASLLPMSQFLGAFAGFILIGLLLPRVRPRAALTGAAVLMALSACAVGLIGEFSPLLHAAFFFIGLPMSTLFALPGIITGRVAGEDGARAMNITFSFMSAGVVASPLIAGFIAWGGFGYALLYLLLSGFALAAAGITLVAGMDVFSLGKGFSRDVLGALFGAHRRTLAVILILGILYMTGEAVPNNWIPRYLRDVFTGVSPFRSRLILSLFWGAMTVGRQLCAALLRRWNRPSFLASALAAGAALSIAAASLARTPIGAEIGFVATGLFLSGVMPIVLSLPAHLPGEASGTSFVLILTVGILGASGMNRVVGGISDAIGFRAGILAGAAPLVGVILVFQLAKVVSDRRA